MPFSIPSEQKEFQFTVNGQGLPLAKVITLGRGRWIAVCPCCGMVHDITTHTGDTFEPRCLVREWNTANYQAWLKKYPDAASQRTVQLVTAERWSELTALPLKVVKKPNAKTRSSRDAEKPKRTRKKAA